ncbi:MAG: hypothetical protein ABL966_05475 [Acidimicrobiales bacterium]
MPVDTRAGARAAEAPGAPTGVRPDPYLQVTSAIVHVAVVLVGVDFGIGKGMSATLPIALGLAPLWIKAVREYTLAPLLLALMGACAVSGVVLSTFAAQDHVISSSSRVQMLGLLLSGAAALALLLWARQEMPYHRVVALYGLGGVVGALAEGRVSWKYGVAVPATFLVLGLVERSGSRARSLLAVILLGLAGAMDDYRSYFAFCLLAAALTLWQMRPVAEDRRQNRWWPAILIGSMASAMYLLTSTLITAGYLGEAVQTRSQEQIEQSGSLLAGGRPEWAATFELMQLKPSGYGVGVVPNLEDVHTAKRGLDSINIGLNPQRDQYMFGTEFRLHSIIADLWVRFGLVGLGLAAVILLAVVRSLSFALAERQAPTSAILASLLALWSLPFEPSYTYWVRVCVALGLVLVLRTPFEARQRRLPGRIGRRADERTTDAGREGGTSWRSGEHTPH